MAWDWGSAGSGAMAGASLAAALGGPMAPLMAVGGGLFGAIGGGLMGGGGKKTSYEDPLAGIRQQLINAAGGYAELAEKQVKLNRARADELLKTGYEDIMDVARGERGFGQNTIELDWKNKLMRDVYSDEAQLNQNAYTGAHTGEVNALSAAMGNAPQMVTNPDYSVGTQVGDFLKDTDWKGVIEGLTPKKTNTTDYGNESTNFANEFANNSGSFYSKPSSSDLENAWSKMKSQQGQLSWNDF